MKRLIVTIAAEDDTELVKQLRWMANCIEQGQKHVLGANGDKSKYQFRITDGAFVRLQEMLKREHWPKWNVNGAGR